MFIIKKDETRPVEEGQYFVELTKNRGLEVVNCDRLGYWCDKGHLNHFALTILGQFNTFELFYKIFSDEKPFKPGNKYAFALEVINEIKGFTQTVDKLVRDLEAKAGAN
jgi:hypothetical protein